MNLIIELDGTIFLDDPVYEFLLGVGFTQAKDEDGEVIENKLNEKKKVLKLKDANKFLEKLIAGTDVPLTIKLDNNDYTDYSKLKLILVKEK